MALGNAGESVKVHYDIDSPRPGGFSGHGGSGLGEGVWLVSGCTLGTSCSPVAR